MNSLAQKIQQIIIGEYNLMANLANVSALINEELSDINWVGFYLYEKETNQLVLGPFQGRVACIRINNGKGVCGTAFEQQEIQRIDNVHTFPGHIACDVRSQSELVIPFAFDALNVSGVLDIDSPKLSRFTLEDQKNLEDCVRVLSEHYQSIDFSSGDDQ